MSSPLMIFLKPVRWFFRQFLKHSPVKRRHLGIFYRINTAVTGLLSEKEKNTGIVVRSLGQFEDKIAPVNVDILEASSPQRISIFLSEINFKYFSGGYIGMLNFARMLHELGRRVRIIVTEQADIDLKIWQKQITKYKGIEDTFEFVEVESIYYRDKTVDFYANEHLVATSWWTAHIVESVRKQLKKDKFLYFIQEFEPLFYPYGSHYTLSIQSYLLPHYAVFSTEILQKYFQENSIGVFNGKSGKDSSISFHNAIVRIKPSAQLYQRSTRKLLFYFRPEFHAGRNLSEVGFHALKTAINNGYFDNEDWKFYGIGSLLPAKSKIQLTDKQDLKIIPKLNLEEYTEVLPEFDIGLSLMLSPHPSLVPIEMCAAGMVVVTNTFANKNETELHRISENFICAEPSINSIERALGQAVIKAANIPERIRYADVNWPTDWKQTFDGEFKRNIHSFFDREGR